MMHLLMAHPGRHFDPTTLSVIPPLVCRVLRLWRKPAVPVSHPEAGAAVPAGERYECCWHCRSGYPCDPRDSHRDPCEHGCNDVPDGVVHVDGVLDTRMLSEVRAEYDERRARQHADIMHAGYARAVDRLRADAGLPSAEEMRQEYFKPPRADETLTDLPVARPYVPQPVYGQACVADVLEAERLNQVMMP